MEQTTRPRRHGYRLKVKAWLKGENHKYDAPLPTYRYFFRKSSKNQIAKEVFIATIDHQDDPEHWVKPQRATESLWNSSTSSLNSAGVWPTDTNGPPPPEYRMDEDELMRPKPCQKPTPGNNRKRKSDFVESLDFGLDMNILSKEEVCPSPTSTHFISSISRSGTFVEPDETLWSKQSLRSESNASTFYSQVTTLPSISVETFQETGMKRQRLSAPVIKRISRSPTMLSESRSLSDLQDNMENLAPPIPSLSRSPSWTLQKQAVKNNCKKATWSSSQTCEVARSEVEFQNEHDEVQSLGTLANELQNLSIDPSDTVGKASNDTPDILVEDYASKEPMTVYSCDDCHAEIVELDSFRAIHDDHGKGEASISHFPQLSLTVPNHLDRALVFQDEGYDSVCHRSRVYQVLKSKFPSGLIVPVDASLFSASCRSSFSYPNSASTEASFSDSSIGSDYEGEDWLDNLVHSISKRCIERVLVQAKQILSEKSGEGVRSHAPKPVQQAASGSNTPISGKQSRGSSEGKRIKRSRSTRDNHNDDQDDGDDDEARRKRRFNHRDVDEQIHHKFACPYNKKFHDICQNRELRNTHRVKEHLYDKHKVIECTRCRQTFPTYEESSEHSRAVVVCQTDAVQPDPRHGFNAETEKLIRCRGGLKGLSEREKWEKIYKALFPGDEHIPDPCVDKCIPVQVSRIAGFRERLLERVTNEVEDWFAEFRGGVLDRLREFISNVTEEEINQSFPFDDETLTPEIPNLSLPPVGTSIPTLTIEDAPQQDLQFSDVPHLTASRTDDGTTVVAESIHEELFGGFKTPEYPGAQLDSSVLQQDQLIQQPDLQSTGMQMAYAEDYPADSILVDGNPQLNGQYWPSGPIDNSMLEWFKLYQDPSYQSDHPSMN